MSDHGTVLDSRTVRFERLLPGPLQRVWDYLVLSEQRATWLAAGDIELWVGGRVTLLFRNNELSTEPTPAKYRQYDKEVPNHGRVTQCQPPHLLAFTWDDSGSAGESASSEVIFELSAVGDQVKLLLTHRRLATRADMLSVAAGWHTHLGILLAELTRSEHAPFWSSYDRLATEYAERVPE